MTEATEAHRMSAEYEQEIRARAPMLLGGLSVIKTTSPGIMLGAVLAELDAVRAEKAADFTNAEFCRFVQEAKDQRDRATRAEQALAEACKALGDIRAASDHLYSEGDDLKHLPDGLMAWVGPLSIINRVAHEALAAASTPAGATEPDTAPCGCPAKPSRVVWHTRVCTLERHSRDLPLPDDMEPAPDEGARGRYPGAHHEPNNPSCGCPGAVCTARRLTVIHDPAVSEMVSAYLDEPVAPDEGARGDIADLPCVCSEGFLLPNWGWHHYRCPKFQDDMRKRAAMTNDQPADARPAADGDRGGEG